VFRIFWIVGDEVCCFHDTGVISVLDDGEWLSHDVSQGLQRIGSGMLSEGSGTQFHRTLVAFNPSGYGARSSSADEFNTI
jgi:hypothetical protein